MKLLIVSPVWGERCMSLFTGPVLDSHADALDLYCGSARYVCHTDEPERVSEAVTRKTHCDVQCLPLSGKGYAAFVNATREAVSLAQSDEVIVFLNADIIVSRETIATIRRLIDGGKKAIMCAGTRTLPKGEIPRKLWARELLAWSIENLHPVLVESIHGSGRTTIPSTIYFRDGESWAMRGFHLHPLAVVNDRPLQWSSTVDWDIAANFPRDQVHVVTRSDELALAEISPVDKVYSVRARPVQAMDIEEWARTRTIEFHWWLFSHRITLKGFGDFGDEQLEQELIRLRDQPRLYFERPPRRQLIARQHARVL